MTVKESEQQDLYGRYYIQFSAVKKIQDVYDWLFNHYWGYKFGVVIDTTKSECENVGNSLYVYFLDELTDEVMSYCDFVKRCEDGKTVFERR